MPRAKTSKVKKRKMEILRLLAEKEKMTTAEIADALDISLSSARYSLMELEVKGLVRNKKSGYGKQGIRCIWELASPLSNFSKDFLKFLLDNFTEDEIIFMLEVGMVR